MDTGSCNAGNVRGMKQLVKPGSKSNVVRIHDLDALRGFAMLLGIFLHAAIFLIPGDSWPVQDPWANTVPANRNFYGVVMFGIHGFRMPLFFLLSGFFTAVLWTQRGLRRLLDHRMKRIGLPLALGTITVIPVTQWVKEGENFDLATWPITWFLDGFDHLWFLWMLLILAGVFMLAVKLGVKFHHFAWWLLVPLSILPMFLMDQKSFGADTSTHVIPEPKVLGYYALFFFFGSFLYQRKIAIRRWWVVFLPPTLTVIFLSGIVLLYPDDFWPWGPEVAWFVVTILQTAYTWLMCFGLFGLFRCVASKERYWVRYLSDASYWLYLWHLALVVALQEVLADMVFSVHLKFLIICLLVPGVLLIMYEWGVRYTWIGTMLNGRRTRVGDKPAQLQTLA